MKKMLAMMLILVMAVSMTACGGDMKTEDPAPEAKTEEAAKQEEIKETEAPAEEPEVTVEPEEEPEVTTEPEEESESISLSEWMKTKTGKFYSQFTSGQMTIEYQMESDGQLIRMKNASKDGKMFIENYEGDEAVACSVIEGETMYIIDHSNKMIIQMGLQQDLVTVANSVIEESDIDMSELKEGTREIDGKTYDTEEWIIDDVATTMCFDGGDLKYIITNPDGTEAFLEILSYSKDVDESLFEIPTDYMTFSM